MRQIIKSSLALPFVYKNFSRLLGGERAVTTIVRDYIRPRRGDKLLDIGCGPAHLLHYLPDISYVGFDINSAYIEAARKEFGARGKFFCQEVSRHVLDEGKIYDLVIAIGVLHHLPDSEAIHLFELAQAALKPEGRLVTVDGCYVPGQSRIARYLLSRDRGQFVRTKESYEHLAKQFFPMPKITIRHDLLRIPFTHIIMECAVGS